MRLTVGLLLLIVTGTSCAGGEWYGGNDKYIADSPVAYAKGCYWHRGVRHCQSYCYLEVNGRRYCSEREREAVPQGYFGDDGRPTVEEIYRRPPSR